MGKRLGLLETNPHRRTRALCVSFDPGMLRLLRQHCPPGSKHLGCFFGQLLVEYVARQEERRGGDRDTPGGSPAVMDVGRTG
jgi:hypothetical protein